MVFVEVVQQKLLSSKWPNDNAEALDEGSTTALILIDLVGAFDVIIHYYWSVSKFPLESRKGPSVGYNMISPTELSVFQWRIKHHQM